MSIRLESEVQVESARECAEAKRSLERARRILDRSRQLLLLTRDAGSPIVHRLAQPGRG